MNLSEARLEDAPEYLPTQARIGLGPIMRRAPRRFDRIGGRPPIPVDFRLIVATNRNLEEMVR
ncbi:MAG TPA: sigma 54-interacting transcriptional regulator [Terriglobia bacterium]|nr:sigma 54-interacting transcriptional regulator [Terriglobia bacterium]